MKILFFGSLYPKERIQEILNKCSYVDVAGDVLQWNFLRGLGSFSDLQVFTVPSIKNYKNILFKDSEFSHNNCSVDYCIGFWDVVGLKQFDSLIKLKRKFKDITLNDEHIVIYSLQSHLLLVAVFLKQKYPNIKISLIVADLPQYMSDSRSIIYRILKGINTKLVFKNLKYVDSYILLSEHMRRMLPIESRPFVVIEGIYNPENDSDIVTREVENNKVLLYTGTLAKRYGVMNLVNAFLKLNNKSVILLICGEGDAKEEIIKASLEDHRIVYKGLLPHKEALSLQRSATLLVNPRTPEGDYTKFSFPSKIMEYFASGTPTLMYKLPGIPEEYFNYCYTIETLGINALASKIDEILNLPSNTLQQKGLVARDFILTQKNPMFQCSKIVEMLKKNY